MAKKFAAGGGGKKATAANRKARRGPKAYIKTNHQANGDEDELAEMAEEMRDAEDDDDEENEGEEEEHKLPKVSGSAKGKSKMEDDFLLRLNERAISKTMAETKRLQKEERLKQQAEEPGPSRKKYSSTNGIDVPDVEDGDSDEASTDMEGASVGSGADDDEVDDEGDLSDPEWDEAEDFSGEEGEEHGNKDDAERRGDREERYSAKLAQRSRRIELQEMEEKEARKRKRLPRRGEQGWDSGEEEGVSGDGEETVPKEKKSRVVHGRLPSLSPEVDEEEEEAKRKRKEPKSTILTGSRFGLKSPYAIMSQPKRSNRIVAAREQIARLATDVVGDPEVGLGMLRRLFVFAGETVNSPDADEGDDPPRQVDDAIRGSAILSLCAVFTDILPGYRIRALSEKEQEERVNQETARRREWEQGLVQVYKDYLESCERILRAKSSISSLALRAMCQLMTRATHFNYRTNLIRSLVSHISRRSWDEGSQLCYDALVEVVQKDVQGEASLEVVRLLNRMIRERRYKVHAKVINILLHLRLRDELAAGKRANTTTVTSADGGKASKGKPKPKEVRKGKAQHLSKKQVKKMKEIKEIEEEMKEAEAEVDHEERERHQTETLKLLFVLYFSILKAPKVSSSLLSTALEGLSRFAHRINVDFFRDLLAVLRLHVEQALGREEGEEKEENAGSSDEAQSSQDDEETQDGKASSSDIRLALLCIVTIFELLSGQGEALNLDMSDMVSKLYTLLLSLALRSDLEEVPSSSASAVQQQEPRTMTDLMLRGLDLALLRPPASSIPAERCAAFIKRILTCSLHTPPTTTRRLLGMARALIARDSRLEALLDTQDRARDGYFDPLATDADVDSVRPLGAGEAAWELFGLARSVNEDVAHDALKLQAWRQL